MNEDVDYIGMAQVLVAGIKIEARQNEAGEKPGWTREMVEEEIEKFGPEEFTAVSLMADQLALNDEHKEEEKEWVPPLGEGTAGVTLQHKEEQNEEIE